METLKQGVAPLVEKKNNNEELEKIRNIFSQYINAGIPVATYIELQKALRENSLNDKYEETLRNSKPTEFFVANPENEDEHMPYLEYIYDHFQGNILRYALVSAVHFRTNEVNLQTPEENFFSLQKGEYYIPIEIFRENWAKLNAEQQTFLRKYIYRGESFSNWFIEGITEGKYFPSPIIICNQEFDEKNHAIKNGGNLQELGVEYLEALPAEKRQLAYTQGSLGHEIAHNIYAYLIYNTELESEWKQSVDETGNITIYAEHWEERRKERDYNENFAEAVRLYTTSCQYMRERGLDGIINFFETNFPEIKQG